MVARRPSVKLPRSIAATPRLPRGSSVDAVIATSLRRRVCERRRPEGGTRIVREGLAAAPRPRRGSSAATSRRRRGRGAGSSARPENARRGPRRRRHAFETSRRFRSPDKNHPTVAVVSTEVRQVVLRVDEGEAWVPEARCKSPYLVGAPRSIVRKLVATRGSAGSSSWDHPWTGRDDAAVATRGSAGSSSVGSSVDGSRRRRGRDADRPWTSRAAAATATADRPRAGGADRPHKRRRRRSRPRRGGRACSSWRWRSQAATPSASRA